MSVYLFRDRIDLSFIEVHPGDWVVLKPNLIKERKETDPSEWRCVITSAELIEQVAEHVCAQLEGRGKVTICDAPQTDSSFKKIAALLGLHEIAARCQERFGVTCEVMDLRNEEWTTREGVTTERRKQAGDPNGTLAVDLGKHSLFYGLAAEGRYYGADYDESEVNRHHCGETQEYLICATPVKADVFINLPKLKTHKKTGVTLSIKNLVGINADKNWLPHHTVGSPENGGDQFPVRTLKSRVEHAGAQFARKIALSVPVLGSLGARRLRKAGSKVFGTGETTIRSGNWHGNDTTWRMAVDLNRCLMYARHDGTIDPAKRMRYYTVIDGVVGMDGNGPMQGDPIQSNIVIGGSNPVEVDAVAATYMGFDWRKLPVIRESACLSSLPLFEGDLDLVQVLSDVPEWCGSLAELERLELMRFRPHFGWLGQIERDLGACPV